MARWNLAKVKAGVKRNTRKRKQTLTTKVNKLAKVIKRNKPEVKYSTDYASVLLDNNPTGSLFPYRLISQGILDINNRIGDNIYVRNIKIQGNLFMAANASPSIVRTIAFVYKKSPDVVITSFATLINLYLNSTTMNTNQSVNAFRDWDNTSSFATLYDRKQLLAPADSSVSMTKPYNFSFKIPEAYRNVKYYNGGVYPTQNELIIAFITDTDSIVTYIYTYQMTYTDV